MKSVKGFYVLSQGLLRIVYCRSNGAELRTLFKGFLAGPNSSKEIDLGHILKSIGLGFLYYPWSRFWDCYKVTQKRRISEEKRNSGAAEASLFMLRMQGEEELFKAQVLLNYALWLINNSS